MTAKGPIISTKFSFVLSNQETLNNIDHLKLIDYQRFRNTNQIGTEILALAKQNQWEQLQALTTKYSSLIPFLKLEIEDAFLSALNLKNYETVKYFLENGFKLGTVAEDAPLTVCYALQYLKGKQLPLDLLQLVLQYGGNPRLANQRDSDTPIHVAARYGNLDFLNVLVQYGGDVNAVNDDRQTPLGCAIKSKKQAAIDFLKGKGATQKWNQ